MEVLRAVLIHLVVPTAGVFLYWQLCLKMKRDNVKSPPFATLFILFSAYGGWLMIFLTLQFWYWSGMALLGAIGLLSVTPVVMFGISIYLFQRRNLSNYHYVSYVASLAYICFVAVLIIYRVFFWQ